MSEPRKELLMQIDNMRSERCAQAVRDALRRLDSEARSRSIWRTSASRSQRGPKPSSSPRR
jgi:hypothetical protein